MSFNLSAEKFVIFTAVLSAIATVLLLGPDVGLAYATSSNTVVATANILSVCYISLTPNAIAFGGSGITPGLTSSANSISDNDLNGNVQASIILYGTDWVSGSNVFFGTNTLWSASSGGSYAAISNTVSSPTNTGLTVAAPSPANNPTSTNIYFELHVPGATPPGLYTQTITIENSC